MNELERELRSEMKRVEVPDGFVGRVMQRAEQREAEIRSRRWRLAIAAALLVSVGAGGTALYERAQRREAEEVRKQFSVAMRVTGRAMDRSMGSSADAVQRAMARIDRTSDRLKGESQ